MSILIKGMVMPKDGELLCINIYPDGKVCINLDLDSKQIATAVPVPDHGRLIDADALVLKGYALSVIRSGSYGAWRDDVPLTDTDAAPTIIQADPPKEEANHDAG